MSCGGSGSSKPMTSPAPEEHPLSALAASGAIVTPTYALRVASDLGWSPVTARDVLRTMDDDIAAPDLFLERDRRRAGGDLVGDLDTEFGHGY